MKEENSNFSKHDGCSGEKALVALLQAPICAIKMCVQHTLISFLHVLRVLHGEN